MKARDAADARFAGLETRISMNIFPDRGTRPASLEEFRRRLSAAGISLSPFPFERIFASFESAEDVVLYRCIKGRYSPASGVDAWWSFDPQHALEYMDPRPGNQSTLLFTQIPQEALRQNIHYYSRRGGKICLTTPPGLSTIAACEITNSGFLSANLLRCMRQVVRFGINPDNEIEKHFGDEFNSAELQFKPVLHEWKRGVEYAMESAIAVPVPEEVRDDYFARFRFRPGAPLSL